MDHVKNICHLELANPLTKLALLVIRQIQDVFNTSRNKSSSPITEAMQICFKNQVKKCCPLNLERQLDKYIYRDLKGETRQIILTVVFIKNYENQISRYVFHTNPSYVFKFSFLITLDIYKDCFKGHLNGCNLIQRFYASIL